MKREFLDLGKQPLGNKFLNKEQIDNEFFYNLKVVFDEDTKLVSMKEFVKPELNFNAEYPYWTSKSVPMIEHFKNTAEMLQNEFNPNKVLEIGSNDGTFIKNFDKDKSICVEPCGNFAKYMNDKLSYKTYGDFWAPKLAKTIKDNHGKFDLIYSANCISHINDLDGVFEAARGVLSDRGVFVFEDPSLLRVIKRGSYDQFYDEHPHMFSVTALEKLLERNELTLFRVNNLSVHGGSNRIYASLKHRYDIEDSVRDNLSLENDFGLNEFEIFEVFAKRVKESRKNLVELLTRIKSEGKRVVSIGATAKSTTLFNYCGIDTSLIELITDTTKDKQGMYSPGSHIPVVDRESVNLNDYDYAFLGAWNFREAIIDIESKFIENGGKFITHVPKIEIIS